ncbi:uncharacterized protein [Dysidea avara]|uniref:uncharacterized protein isoform X1 n=1 Tax=Dysidea avara TaxID=196820 RepID=UPI0033304129
MLNSNLSGLLLKVCHTVRSYQMRCLREMKEVLTKGYKVQVLSYSIHVLLNRVKDQLTAGNLDVTISEGHQCTAQVAWCLETSHLDHQKCYMNSIEYTKQQ